MVQKYISSRFFHHGQTNPHSGSRAEAQGPPEGSGADGDSDSVLGVLARHGSVGLSLTLE